MRPFLKWAGGKHLLASQIKQKLPSGTRLIEPFSGAAAITLNTDFPRYLLGEVNPDLINLFKLVKKEGADFVTICRQFFTERYNTEKSYYNLRDTFNTTHDLTLKSALFVYLNRHGYNGLCRYNHSGKFNVPFGRYLKPYFPEKEMIFFSKKAARCEFKFADFTKTMARAKPGDVVYCDPPYAPLSKTAGFTDYATGGFGHHQQQKLAELAIELSQKKIPVIISNHATEIILSLYKQAEISIIPVRRVISCQTSKRNSVNEVIAVF